MATRTRNSVTLLERTSMNSFLGSCTQAATQARGNKGNVYKACTDGFISLSYQMYEGNCNALPIEWYTAEKNTRKTWNVQY